MASSNDNPPPNPLSPFHTPAGGMAVPAPLPPYGPGAGTPLPTPLKAKTGPTPAGMLHALKRRWVLATFLGGLVACAAAAAVWTLMPTGKHQGKALVRLRQKTSELGKSQEDFDAFRRDQMVILRTRDLITRTLAEPSIASLETVKTSDDPVRWMEEGLIVKDVSPTTLAVTLTGDNPDDLKLILDMLVKKYIDDATSYDRRTRDDQMRKLEALAEKLKGEIQSKERAIQLMIEANNSAGGDGAQAKQARMQQELAKLDADVFATQKEIQELETKITVLHKKVEAKRYDLDPLEMASVVNADPRISALLSEKMKLQFTLSREREIASLKDGDPLPPTILELQTRIETTDKQLAASRKAVEPEVAQMMGRISEQQLKNRIADDKDKLEAARALYANRGDYRDKFQKGMTQAFKGDFQANTLLKELEPQREALNTIERQRVQLQIEKDMDARVSLIEAPFVQMNLNAKQKMLLSIGAAVFSFSLVIVVIGFLEWRTRRIDSVDQVVTELGMRVIGTVPSFPNRASLKAADANGNANWRFALSESINSTRTMLLHSARAQSMQVVMVTSATQGEGKTSLASQLGTSMATAGMRTLIVDCDLRNPSIHKLFDLGLQMGVSEVLCQEVDASDAVQPTAVPNLWVIPAGQCSTRVITALAQGHPLETLFNRLRGQFDFIIVDSCPVLPVADALLIGQHVDGVVFSIMQDISQLPKVLVASEKLQQLNVPLLGAVVNNVSGGSAYYAYGYNYVKQLPA
jgi:polysaccharide biosynthesis transport protein